MEEINIWLENRKKDYQEGVELYGNTPGCNQRILSQLQRGKNSRNLSILIRELRKVKTSRPVAPKKQKPKAVSKVSQKSVVKTSPEEELKQKEAARQSVDKFFQRIRYGELPGELKVRFREAKDLFYDMCDLKVLLNSLANHAEDKALEIMLQIESLDTRKDMIWKELEHWQNYKTLLPTKSDEDFSKLSPQKLFLKKANLASSISKISKRIEGWKADAEKESDKTERLKIEQQISRSERKLHQHEINLRKIEELLN